MTNYEIIKKEVPTFFFVGVTTGKSAINDVFPLWMNVLGFPQVVLEGIDHPIHDNSESYRQTVAQIKYDPNSLGGLVTTHKLDLFSAAEDMFDYLDPYAQITRELSSISKRDGQLCGHAKDPITAGLSLDSIIFSNYFGETGGDVLCLGAGGSAMATLLHLINKPDSSDRPGRFVAVDRSQGRLDHMHNMVKKYETDIDVHYVLNSEPTKNDVLMAQMADHSVVINATGMGKDIPGSPITDGAFFPQNGVAWEFNYRGERDFMHQALNQAEARNLIVEDGWVYFIHGWSQVIFEVLDIQLTPEIFQQLDEAASSVRKK
ncbi:MAG: shikimate dehydrogenase [Chloroflexota bacterium]